MYLLHVGIEIAFGLTWNLPDNKKTRFTSDHFNVPRPALLMRGFNNTENDNYLNVNVYFVNFLLLRNEIPIPNIEKAIIR